MAGSPGPPARRADRPANLLAFSYFDPSASVLDIFDRYSVDIDFVKWNGTDIKPVLEITDTMEEIQEASVRYVAGIFHQSMNKAA